MWYRDIHNCELHGQLGGARRLSEILMSAKILSHLAVLHNTVARAWYPSSPSPEQAEAMDRRPAHPRHPRRKVSSQLSTTATPSHLSQALVTSLPGGPVSTQACGDSCFVLIMMIPSEPMSIS